MISPLDVGIVRFMAVTVHLLPRACPSILVTWRNLENDLRLGAESRAVTGRPVVPERGSACSGD